MHVWICARPDDKEEDATTALVLCWLCLLHDNNNHYYRCSNYDAPKTTATPVSIASASASAAVLSHPAYPQKRQAAGPFVGWP